MITDSLKLEVFDSLLDALKALHLDWCWCLGGTVTAKHDEACLMAKAVIIKIEPNSRLGHG